MPVASSAFVAVLLVCTGGEGCDTVAVKDATRYVSKSDCIAALPALPPMRKSKYKCEQEQTMIVRRAKPIAADDVAATQLPAR